MVKQTMVTRIKKQNGEKSLLSVNIISKMYLYKYINVIVEQSRLEMFFHIGGMKIGDACEIDSDCRIPFAECIDSKCKCQSGYRIYNISTWHRMCMGKYALQNSSWLPK